MQEVNMERIWAFSLYTIFLSFIVLILIMWNDCLMHFKDCIVYLQNSYVETLTPNVTIFGDRVSGDN